MDSIDPKFFQKLASAIKLMTSVGNEMSGKARDLMTLAYAIREGYIKQDEHIKKIEDAVADGKFELPQIKKYLQSLNYAEDVIDDIITKRKELDKVDSNRIRKLRDEEELLDLIYDIENDRFNLASKTTTAFDQLNSQLIDQHRLITSMGLANGTNTDILTKQLQKHRELKKVFVNENLSSNEIKGHFEDISNVIDNIGAKSHIFGGLKFSSDDAIQKLNKVSDHQIGLLSIEDQLRRKKLEEFVAYASGQFLNIETGELFDSDGVQVVGDKFDGFKSITDQYETLISKVHEYGGLTSDITTEIYKSVDALAEKRNLTGKAIDDLKTLTVELVKQSAEQKNKNALTVRNLQLSQQNLEILKHYAPALQSAKSAAGGLADKVEGLLDVIPAGLQKFLGLSDIGDNIRTSSTDAIKVFNKKLIETGSTSKAINASIKTWGTGIRGAVGVAGSLALILTGAYKITKMLDDATKHTSEQMGISLLQAKKINRANLDLVSSQENQFSTLSDIRGVQEAYIKSTGQAFDLTTKHGQHMVQELSEIGKVFGYGSERAVELNETFMQLGANEEFATSLQRDLGFMTEMAGLSPEMISRDLLESADILSTYFAGMPEEAAKTIIQVRRMGMSLRKAGDIAKSMLNLEGFMTDMFELAAMGGPDFSKAFDLGISGDIEGMTKEIMDSIGSVKAFGEMDFLQREKLAKTLGMSTDQISKSLMLREKMVGLDKDQAALLEANIDRMGNIEGMDQKAILARLSQLQSTDRLSVAWNKIKAVLIKAILPIAEAFTKTLEDGSPILDTIIGGFKLLGIVIKGVSFIVAGMMIPIQLIGKLVGVIIDGVEWLVGLFGKADRGAKDVNTSMATMGVISEGTLKFIGGIAGAWFFVIKPISKIIPMLKSMGGLLGALKDRIIKMAAISNTAGKGGLLGKIFGAAPTMEFDKATKRWRDLTSGKFVKTPEPKRGLLGRLFGSADVETPSTKTTQGKSIVSPEIGKTAKVPTPKSTTIGKVPTPTTSTIGKAPGDNVSKLGAIAKSAPRIAASLLILSGALWIFSKAVQNFIGVKWEDIGKATASLLGLVGISKLLNSAKSQMIQGAIGIAILGAALIPLGYSLKFFSDVKWGDLAKAGAAMVGLTLVGAIIGSLAPQMILGAIGLAAMGAALIPAAIALGMFAEVKWEDLAKAGVAIIGLTAGIAALGAIMMSGIGAAIILSGAAALAAMGLALMPLASAIKKFSDSNPREVGSGLKIISEAISEFDKVKISDGDNSPINKLKELASIANPLTVISRTILQLGESINELSNSLASADFSKLSEFEKLKGITSSIGVRMPIMGEGSRGIAQAPSKESTAQNLLISEGNSMGSSDTAIEDEINRAIGDSKSSGSTKKLESLLLQLISEVQGINKRPIVLDFGDGTLKTVNTRIKGLNNNR